MYTHRAKVLYRNMRFKYPTSPTDQLLKYVRRQLAKHIWNSSEAIATTGMLPGDIIVVCVRSPTLSIPSFYLGQILADNKVDLFNILNDTLDEVRPITEFDIESIRHVDILACKGLDIYFPQAEVFKSIGVEKWLT